MPDAGEPVPGAPENYWAGQYDAEQFANALGMTWTTGIFATTIPRMVNIPTLCAAPKPAAPEFTTADILTGIVPGSPGRAAADAKIVAFTNAYLWEQYCTPIGDPPPVVEPQPPPADLPTNPLPVTTDEKRMRDMYRWLYWMATEYVPRTFETGDSTSVSGTGHWTIAPKTDGEWDRESVGVKIVIDAKPDYVGRSNGGDFPVFYDLGWYSLDSGSGAQSPIRLHHTEQITTASSPKVAGFFYNLAPGVEITVTALYPNAPSPPEGIG